VSVLTRHYQVVAGFSKNFLASALAVALPFVATAAAGRQEAVSDFTFIQATDIHTPMAQSKATLSAIPKLGEIKLAPYGVTVPKPAFAIVTGDLTEFGGGNGWWQEYLSYWNGCGIKVYHGLGNHDNTWHANIKNIRDAGLAPYYSFDQHGCHFVSLTTATAQDPRPSVAEEQLIWLKQDLEKVSPRTPVFAYFHHPLGGSEFASRYDYDRLLDILRGYNTVLLLAGHSHGYAYRPIEGIDQTTGGSTFGAAPGFAVISVKDGMLREAYWKTGQPAPDIKLLEKRIPETAPFPRVSIAAPAFRQVAGGKLRIEAALAGKFELERASYTIDDEQKGELKLSGQAPDWKAAGEADLAGLLPGAHYLRVEFSKGENHYTRSTQFFYEPTTQPTAWRAYLRASSKVTPAVAAGVVYVGANDGKLRAFEAATGKELWAADTGAEILAEPLVAGPMVYTANGLGRVSAYHTNGTPGWTYSAGDAVYSSPVIADGKLVFGCNDGKLYALDLSTGRPVWINTNAAYTIESKPLAADGRIYYGAWDEYIRCVDLKDGKQLWERKGEGSNSAKGAKRYYSPADAAPVMVEGNLLVADRAMRVTILDAKTGDVINGMRDVSAAGVAEDGKAAYLRRMDGHLTKVDKDGKEIWNTPAHLGAIPTAPIEKDGTVYVSSGKGTVSAVNAATGAVRWQYQASPQLFVMCSVASDGTNAYLTSFDGSLTAIKCQQAAPAK
jgi:outer membrane protein assembly factor BamB